MTNGLNERLALSACLRETTFRTPLIKHAAAKAVTGRNDDAPHYLQETIRHTRELLLTLERQQIALGWREDVEQSRE